MFPQRFNYSHSRPHSDRSPKSRHSHGDSRERRDPHSERERTVYTRYSGESESRRRDYSTSPKKPYRTDSFDIDRSRRSQLRSRMSSPGWDSSERKRQSFEGEGSHYSYDNSSDTQEGGHRFSHVSESKTRQWSSGRSDAHVTKDLEHAEFLGKDFRHTQRSPDYRHRHHREEVAYQHPHDTDSRLSSGNHKDRDGQSGHGFPERKPPEGQSSKYYKSDVEQKRAAVPQQSTSAKGFQRFLDLLNKGVDVNVLNKIVGQTSSNQQTHSPHSTLNIDEKQHCDDQLGESGPPQWQVSEQSVQRSLSPEKSSHPSDSRSRSRSPQRAGKVTLTPEDEHKHKQMQDVLQAIGLNLGFEELGQMSHRIQERLYGKRESSGQGGEGKSKQKDWRRGRAPSPRSQSRSSSSSSSRSLSLPEGHAERDSSRGQAARPGQEHQGQEHQGQEHHGQEQHPGDQHLGQQHTWEQHPGDQHPGQQHLWEQHPGDQHPGQQHLWEQHPGQQQAATYSYQGYYPPPVAPTYPPANYPTLPYPSPLPPPLPHMPQVPALFLPPRPPLPSTPLPHFNAFPPQMAHTSYCPPQYAVGPQPWFNPVVQPTINNNNNQKAKTPSRHRYLQVIETKQAG